MFGQGSPLLHARQVNAAAGFCRFDCSSDLVGGSGIVVRRARGCAVAVLLLAISFVSTAFHAESSSAWGSHPQETSSTREHSIRLRFAWGGGTAKRWQGSVTLTGGRFGSLGPLSLEADAGATCFQDQNRIMVEMIKRSDFAGFDVDLEVTLDAQLQVDLVEEGNPENRMVEVVSVRDFIENKLFVTDAVGGGFHAWLDRDGNRLGITRAPGDGMRVQFSRNHLVFSPSEPFEFSLLPIPRALLSSSDVKLVTEIRRARGDQILESREWLMTSDDDSFLLGVPVVVDLPQEEGAYNIRLSLMSNSLANSITNRLTRGLGMSAPLLERTIQVVVVGEQGPESYPPSIWQEVASLDPTETEGWRERLTSLGSFRLNAHGASGFQNGGSGEREFDGQQMLTLEPGSWKAIPLKVDDLSRPHRVEIEYLDDGAMALGVNILEPNAQGGIQPFGIDSGISIPERTGSAGTEPRLRTHRLWLWPGEQVPYLLFTNRHEQRGATIGKVRILSGPEHLPAKPKPGPVADCPTRGYFAFYEQPLFAENFSAHRLVDPQTGQSVDDWHSFFVGARRWIEYLKSNGYTGAMVVVAGDGSSLFPSSLLQPSPRFDNGRFATDGKDPVRKDVVEMLFRLFQRNDLQLVPVMHFNGPLPKLERMRLQQPGVFPVGIDLVDTHGQTLRESFRESNEVFSYYNYLDPRVRDAAAEVIGEFVDRYRGHSSWGGIGILYSRNAGGVFPGQTWGADQVTLSRFAQDTQRVDQWNQWGTSFLHQILESEYRQEWLDWRISQSAAWLQTVRAKSRGIPGDVPVFVLGTDLFHSQGAFSALAPSLRRNSSLIEAAQRIAFPANAIQSDPGIVFLKPYETAPESSLAQKRLDFQLNHSKQFETLVGSHGGGALFTHRYSWNHFPELESQWPYGRGQHHPFARMQPLVPSGIWGREPVAYALQQSDCQYLVHGGWLTSFGQEEHSAGVIDVLTQLPLTPFQDVAASESSSSEITVRQARKNGKSYVYLVNPTPWPVHVEMDLSGDVSEWRSLAGHPMRLDLDGALQVSVHLEPFDVAGAVASESMEVLSYQVHFPENLQSELQSRLNRLLTKVSLAAQAPPIDRLNDPGFESMFSALRGQQQTGWEHHPLQQVYFSEGRDEPLEGSSYLALKSDGPVVWLRSNEFEVPRTGRLSISAWLRVPDANAQPVLRMCVESDEGRQIYYRFGTFGANSDQANGTIGSEWKKFAVHFNDLPLADAGTLRVGFDLMGAGQVEIDQVEIYDRWLDSQDCNALTQLLALAGFQLTEHQKFDRCRRILESYWPQFLNEYFSEEDSTFAGQATAAGQLSATPEKENDHRISFLRRLLPR